MTELGTFMRSEIAEQPEVFERSLASAGRIEPIAEAIRDFQPRFVLFAARGTSDHAALYGKYLFEIESGLPVGLMSPSSITIYGAEPKLKDTLVIVISQSGGSPDLVETARKARSCGGLVLGITNSPDSELAHNVDLHIDVLAGVERAVAATKSYSAQMLALWILIKFLNRQDIASAQGLSKAAQEILSRHHEFESIAESLREADRLILTGRGYSLPSALEAALKIAETSYFDAHAFSAADLLHGPMAMVANNTPVIAVSPPGVAQNSITPTLERLSETTSRLIVFGPSSQSHFGSSSFTIDHSLPDDLSPLVEIIALQEVIVRMAIMRGHNPDAPRGLSKVTKTL